MRSFIALCGVCAAGALALVSAGRAGQPVTQTLNPPVPSYYDCKAVGSGTICDGQPPLESYGPVDSGLTCGSGSGAFTILDSGVDQVTARRIYDEDGNLVRRVLRDDYSVGQSMNSVTGATVAYRQRDTRTDVLAVPGDLSSATETTTWEILQHLQGGGAPVVINTGRTVQGPDGTTEFRAGRLAFWQLFEDGDTSVIAPLCAALAGA